ncbi:MAG TPA: ATP-binding cassette domain-containing protein [Myxococcaceae bacterium]|nr:ATP-binding cassette domain-containing protein [Myxococcaceae bacterium]
MVIERELVAERHVAEVCRAAMPDEGNATSLAARRITKHFPSRGHPFVAVNDLSFELAAGESVAFLGPNGAGKSTTIKILCGILTPTSGHAEIGGFPAGSQHANRQLGLVFGTRSQLFMHMTVGQCLDLIAEIYFLSGKPKRRRIADLTELFEIGSLVESRVRTLSLGQRMRCEVVAALLHQPKVLLADEPTIGLDVIAKNKLRELVLRWQREEKSTFLLTSHDLSDVEALCGRCILIDRGVKRFDGPLAALKGDFSDLRRVQITVSDRSVVPLTDEVAIRSVGQEPFIHRYETRTRDMPMAEVLSRLCRHYGDGLQDIQVSEVGLEEVLAHHYSGRA